MRAGQEPTGWSGDTFFVLAMYDQPQGLTIRELHQWIARENTDLGAPVPSPEQVTGALHQSLAKRRPPLVERYPGHRWRVSDHGQAMLARWCGEDDEPIPRRVPCGLGWPA